MRINLEDFQVDNIYGYDVRYVYVKNNSVINVILPSSLASEAANGDLIASPVYVSTSSIWIEPMRLPALYELYGRTYPEVLQIVNLGGTNLIKIPNYFAIG